MLNTQVVSGASDQDLVVLDLVFDDETFETSAPLRRWEAHQAILVVGPPYEILWGPYRKRVALATIIEYAVDTTATFDPDLPIH